MLITHQLLEPPRTVRRDVEEIRDAMLAKEWDSRREGEF